MLRKSRYRFSIRCFIHYVAFAASAPLLFLSLGCWRPPTPTPQELDRGMIVLFPGVGGGLWEVEGPTRAFRAAGVKAAIRALDWQNWLGSLRNLIDEKHNRKMAARLASELAEYAHEHPGRPIDLVGYSGGGGLALFVVEALPDDVRPRNVILVHAAISTGYDLTPALRKMAGVVVNLYSRRDSVILGAGTRLFGAMDRVYENSAGYAGFDVSRAVADSTLQKRVLQRAWTTDDDTLAYYGGHYDIVAMPWNRVVIAPYLLGAAAKIETTSQPASTPESR